MSAKDANRDLFGTPVELETMFRLLNPIHMEVPLEAFISLYTCISDEVHHQRALHYAAQKAEKSRHSNYLKYIIVQKANNLPKMDIIGTCDAYVALNVVNQDGTPKPDSKKVRVEPINGKTEVKKNMYDPVWNEAFIMEVPAPVANFRARLQVWDFDRMTTDDVVGWVDLTEEDIGSVTRAIDLAPGATPRGNYQPTLTCSVQTLLTPMPLFSDAVHILTQTQTPHNANMDTGEIMIPVDGIRGFQHVQLRITYKYASEAIALDLTATYQQTFERLTTVPERYIGLHVAPPHQGYQLLKSEALKRGARTVTLSIPHMSILTALEDITIVTAQKDSIFSDTFATIAASQGLQPDMTYQAAKAACPNILFVDETMTGFIPTSFGHEGQIMPGLLQAAAPVAAPATKAASPSRRVGDGTLIGMFTDWLHGDDDEEAELKELTAPVKLSTCGMLFEYDWDAGDSRDFSLMLTKETGTGTPDVAIDLSYQGDSKRTFSFFAGDMHLKGGNSVVQKCSIYDVQPPHDNAKIFMSVDRLVDPTHISLAQVISGTPP
mmetsp:Transcript_12432/g.37362  ORF Transcript_12432/g.37362 Transcript_12432/m.37362 type:complete len:549 (-) Transcript_12432:262-1908(-)